MSTDGSGADAPGCDSEESFGREASTYDSDADTDSTSDSDLDPFAEYQHLMQLFVEDAQARGLTPDEINAEWQAMSGPKQVADRIEGNLHRIEAAPVEQRLAEEELYLLSCCPFEVANEKARGGVCYLTLAVAKRRLLLAMLYHGSQFILPQGRDVGTLCAALPTEEELFAQIGQAISTDGARHSRLREILHNPNNGVDANALIGAYMEPLIVRIAPDPDCLRLLLDKGADANAGTEIDGVTALEICVRKCVEDPTGDLTSVQMLIEGGARSVAGGGTALHTFATTVCELFCRAPESIANIARLVTLRDALLNAGLRPNKQDYHGQTWKSIILAGPSGPEMRAAIAALLGPEEPPIQTEVQTARVGELSEAMAYQ